VKVIDLRAWKIAPVCGAVLMLVWGFAWWWKMMVKER